jgi:serine/threonine protein kinase
LFPNQPVQCAHLDFKPENILVFWPGDGLYEDRRAKKPVRKPNVGLWKITDFGISRTRTEPRPQVHSLYPTDTVGGTTREHSSMDATRAAGPFQPPEARKEGRVSWSTDMWSFGCVAVLVLAFILGGPEKVIELDRQRMCHENDYFWTTDISKLDIVKPEIHQWLNDQQQSSTPWIQQYIAIIQSLLQIDRKSRSKASIVRSALQGVWELTENIPSLWSPRSDDIYLRPASVRIAEPDGRETSPVSFAASSGGDIEDDNTLLQTPRPRIVPPVSTSIGGARNLGIEFTTHPRRSAEIVRPGPSLARLSQLLRTWPAAPSQTWYARLSTPRDTIQAVLSADAKTLAFYSKDRAYIYDLQKILDLPLFWQETPGQKSMQLLKDGLKIYHCPAGRTLTSVLATGPFIAFQSESNHINELVSLCTTSTHF